MNTKKSACCTEKELAVTLKGLLNKIIKNIYNLHNTTPSLKQKFIHFPCSKPGGHLHRGNAEAQYKYALYCADIFHV